MLVVEQMRSELDGIGRTAYNMPIFASCHIIILCAMPQDNSWTWLTLHIFEASKGQWFPPPCSQPKPFYPILRRALQIAELGDRNKVWQKETLKHDPEYLSIVIRFGRDCWVPIAGRYSLPWPKNCWPEYCIPCAQDELKTHMFQGSKSQWV